MLSRTTQATMVMLAAAAACTAQTPTLQWTQRVHPAYRWQENDSRDPARHLSIFVRMGRCAGETCGFACNAFTSTSKVEAELFCVDAIGLGWFNENRRLHWE